MIGFAAHRLMDENLTGTAHAELISSPVTPPLWSGILRVQPGRGGSP
jgi:hypothetical protein